MMGWMGNTLVHRPIKRKGGESHLATLNEIETLAKPGFVIAQ